jgi:diguanylate cyclase
VEDNDRGRLVGAVIVFHDVTERRRLSREIAERAVRDALTGLCNRCEFETRLEETVASARGGEVHSLMYLDLDHFKIVNDTCGHPVGDQLLRELAEVFRQSVRSSDLVARLGGDEFGILLPHCNAEAALRTANELLKRVESFRFQHEMGRFRVGVSIGLVQIDGACANSETLMQSADTACYAAKEAGGQRVLVWQDKGQTAELRGRMVWAQRLSDAIEGDAFDLHLQRMEPLGDAPLPAHVEVLLRLRNADAGVVYPGEFLPAAERFRLAPSIDRWVLEQVIQRLSADPLAHVRVSVNFSGQSLSDRAFRDEALGLLRAAGPSISSRLCVEITETEAVRNYADAADFMGRLRDQGASVALDDYGAGASSFAYLRRLPIDWLKIDGQFVKDLPNQRLNFIAMRAFVDAAHSVGARCVAEHVETEQELEALRLLGLDLAQGFLLHRPVDWATVWATLPRHPLPQPAVTTLKH